VKQFDVGEEVVFLREPGGGVIKRIERNIIFVEDDTGFERPFYKKDIGKIYGTDYKTPIINPLENSNILQKSNKKIKTWYTPYKNYWEIDLHYEEIVQEDEQKDKKHNTHILNQQIRIFKEIFWLAREKKVRKLIVIHGFGKGILRKELQLFLIAQEGVDFFDAPYIEYGHGAIQIEIKYKY